MYNRNYISYYAFLRGYGIMPFYLQQNFRKKLYAWNDKGVRVIVKENNNTHSFVS